MSHFDPYAAQDQIQDLEDKVKALERENLILKRQLKRTIEERNLWYNWVNPQHLGDN